MRKFYTLVDAKSRYVYHKDDPTLWGVQIYYSDSDKYITNEHDPELIKLPIYYITTPESKKFTTQFEYYNRTLKLANLEEMTEDEKFLFKLLTD